ncbi:MAG: threonylcarbamoyl-AMP synthase [Clostridia bacterium]|nr:threonylcarbamoyl-AMP synthase [Clostridia bacterium]
MDTKVFTKNELREAAAIIRDGGVVAMPTETVYGLAANALDTEAVRKIYEAKGRQSDNPLIVHIANISDWSKLVEQIPQSAKLLAERFWPGPLTIVLKKSPLVPDIVSGGLDTVAVRMPKNKIAFRFIKECGVPLAAPSANVSGAPSPTKFTHVYKDMNGKIDGIIDGGDCMVGLESTVISLVEDIPTILRPGRITTEQIRKVIGEVIVHHTATGELSEGEKPLSPGMKYKHYAPRANLQLVKGSTSDYVTYVKTRATEKTAIICFDEDMEALRDYHTFSLGAKADSVTHAKRLFDILRAIDDKNLTEAYAPLMENNGVSLAVNNRLLRAAGFHLIDLTMATSADTKNTAVEKAQPESAGEVKNPIDLSELDAEEMDVLSSLDKEPNPAPAAVRAQPTEIPAPAAVQPPQNSAQEVSTPAQTSAESSEEQAEDPLAVTLGAMEEDSAILALNDIQFGEDFNEDFSKAISDNITVVEKTEEDDPTKIFYEALIDEDGIKPAAYPVDTIDEDFQFDVYDDDIPRRKGLFSRIFGKKEDDDVEPEPFLPMPNAQWNSQAILQADRGEAGTAATAAKADEPAVQKYEKIPGIRVVGITGKTGCGKTFIANRLAAKTPHSIVINADDVYHSMLSSDSLVLSIVVAFGDEVLDGKTINRKKLASIAFGSEENLNKLNRTVLPAVAQKIISLIEHAKASGVKTVFLDAPTLIESGLNQVCNEVIFIIADPAIRQERIVERDNITLDEIGQRMRFEKDDSFYVRYADRIIRNN